jgi:uracil-DNA glycosylase family 4
LEAYGCQSRRLPILFVWRRHADLVGVLIKVFSVNPASPCFSLELLNADLLACRKCPRLVSWREQVAHEKRRAYRDWEYWGKPVPGFGDPLARLLAVGLAPGAHGSNRTGRMFTGDASGDFLYPALYRAGFANQPGSTRAGDGLELHDLFISAVCRCAPPDNKPTPAEMANCQPYLAQEIRLLQDLQGIVALGKIAFDAVLRLYRAQGMVTAGLEFAHGACYELGQGQPWLLASYHPSRQNTQTGRLTVEMFDRIWLTARSKLTQREHHH